MKRSAGCILEVGESSCGQPTAGVEQINPSMHGNVAVRPVGRQLIRRSDKNSRNRQVGSPLGPEGGES